MRHFFRKNGINKQNKEKIIFLGGDSDFCQIFSLRRRMIVQQHSDYVIIVRKWWTEMQQSVQTIHAKQQQSL